MEVFAVLLFCTICSAHGFSESSILTSISPTEDEFYDMVTKGESKEMIRIVPSVITNFTTTDVQSPSDSPSITFAKSDANVVTETAPMISMNLSGVSESLTQPLIAPIINDPVGDDEMVTITNVPTTMISITDDIRSFSDIQPDNDKGVTSEETPMTSINSNVTPESFIPRRTVLVTSDPVGEDVSTTTASIPTTMTTTIDDVQRTSQSSSMASPINFDSGDSADADPIINEVGTSPEIPMGPLARLLINPRGRWEAQGKMNSTLSTIPAGRKGVNSTTKPLKMNSTVHKPTFKTDASHAIKAIRTWFREVGKFFRKFAISVRNFFHRG